MKFGWIDVLSITIVSLGAGIQFLRAIKDFSLVLYETVFFVLALVGAGKMFMPVHNLTGWSCQVCFAGIFAIFAILGIIIASILNSFEFEFGGFNYFFGLIFGIVCGFVVGHVCLKSLIITYCDKNPEVIEAIHRSWVASQVLYFGAFRELLGMLRLARYHNI